MTEEKFIINIHTTGESAIVVLSKGDHVLGSVLNHEFKEHAKFLHPAINQLLKESHITPSHLSAVSVTHGPGSYTGIRVGLSAAKGLCYALKIPLITLNTLDVLAICAIQKIDDSSSLYCPMIDARRMEVYTAMYNFQHMRIMEPQAIILDFTFSQKFTQSKKVCFFGSGSLKFQDIIGKYHANYSFIELDIQPEGIAKIGYRKFLSAEFSDLAYSEPEYLKDFISTTTK